MKKENAPRKTSERKQADLQDISATAQRQRLMMALRNGPVTTLAARTELEIMHPASRVQELRESGCNIITHWQTIETLPGVRHRVAKYILLPSSPNEKTA